LVKERLGSAAPESLYVLGDEGILLQPMIALVCSVKCPGSVVIRTFDAIRELRDAGIVVAGGFHSPMEQECLDFLLRGQQSVLMSPAKGLGRPRLSGAAREAIDEGRLTIATRFAPSISRTNKQQSRARNEFIAALATAILIPHASPGGNAETIAQQAIARKQPVFTINDSENEQLISMGGRPYQVSSVQNRIGQFQTYGRSGRPNSKKRSLRTQEDDA
jgi:predicted Rossmann fold nucleotide-binding protein DprA/Smf involved in DNA uptake